MMYNNLLKYLTDFIGLQWKQRRFTLRFSLNSDRAKGKYYELRLTQVVYGALIDRIKDYKLYFESSDRSEDVQRDSSFYVVNSDCRGDDDNLAMNIIHAIEIRDIGKWSKCNESFENEDEKPKAKELRGELFFE